MLNELKKIVKKIPGLKKIREIALFIIWHFSVSLNSILNKSLRLNDSVIWVSPDRITYALIDPTIEKDKSPFIVGKIVDGNWDLMVKEIDTIDFFYSSYQHYLDQVPWEETDFYIRIEKQLENGLTKFGCNTKEEWKERLKKDNGLFDMIKQEGYSSQKQLRSFQPWDEIRVCVGREGDIYFSDGRHRLAIAKALKIKEIPVIVTHVHKQWYQTNESLDIIL